MMTHKQLEEYILQMPGTKLDYPFGEGTAVYKTGGWGLGTSNLEGGKMFAIIQEASNPPRISLKCDPLLAETLRKKYETVLPGYHLNKKHWNTIICTGQLDEEEIQGLIRHSYNLVVGSR